VAKGIISFRIAPENKAALDHLARRLERDRSHVLNRALSLYLELEAAQIAHVEAGLRDAQAGHYASGAEIEGAFARWLS
jgi:predicted transcriptional regulator